MLSLGVLAVLFLAAACADSSASGDSLVELQPAFGGQAFDNPVELVPEPAGTFLLAEQSGLVWRIDGDSDHREEVLDLSARVMTDHREEGLLSLALDPSFDENRRVWLYYSAPEPRRSVLSRFTMEPGGAIDPASEQVVLEVPQPYGNHNGGAIRFGPDDMLYLGIGDGGDAWDPHGNGQDRSTLLGSLIRIDVSEGAGGAYSVPLDNPFVDDAAGRPEIWAYGLRNPWRMSFDPATGDLWVGDVGQDLAEEINIVEAGGNYGWSIMEGFECLDAPCPGNVYRDPEYAYGHDAGCAITGGIAYRGDEIPELEGRYVFGDLCSSELWAYTSGEGVESIAGVDGPVVSFAEGHDGEFYAVQFGGPVLRIRAP